MRHDQTYFGNQHRMEVVIMKEQDRYQVLMSYSRFEYMSHGHGWRTVDWSSELYRDQVAAERAAREVRDHALSYHISHIM